MPAPEDLTTKTENPNMFARFARKGTINSPADERPEAEPPVRLPRSRGFRITGRFSWSAAALAAAVAAFAVIATTTSAHASGAAARIAPVARVSVIAAPAHPGIPGGAGWQGLSTYNVSTGLNALFYHLQCPSGLIVQSGGFQTLGPVTGTELMADGLWPNADNSTWLWDFKWPGGAPSGESIRFEIYCTTGPS
jgi:hypothetical protein